MIRYFLRRRRFWLLGILALMLALGLLLAWNLVDPMDCRMAPGVTIGGLDVAGMTRRETWKTVRSTARERLQKEPLTLVLPGEELTIDPKAANIRVSAWKAVRDAYGVGRRKNAKEPELPLSRYLKYDEGYLIEQLETYASRQNTTLTSPTWKVRGQMPELSTDRYDPEAPGQTVELTLGQPERRLNVEDALKQLLAGYDRGLTELPKHTIDVPCKTEPPEPNLEEIYNTCLIKPKNDGIDLENHKIKAGSFGYHFDMDKARKMVEEGAFGETISIPMEVFAPEVYADDVYYKDVLGFCETKHTADENRNTNLRLVCEFLNGYIIQPGEEFSYNQAVGERTPERGFMPATVFAGDRVAKDYGGGVCQGSTTLYNCLLLADMEVLERHGHGALVSYVPLGLDAAVNWGTSTDLRFVNNSHFPVMIHAELSDGYMKMQLLGTDEKDYYIKLETNQIEEPGVIYAGSYMLKFDKTTDERISRERIAFSTYVTSLPG